MADNVTLNSGSGGASIASDDIAGVQYQRVKVCYGADGAATDASATAPLPVKVTDGTNNAPTMDAVGRAGFQKITDGTNTMPTMDAVGRRGYMTVTDGTNSMPTADAVARAHYTLASGEVAHDAADANNPLKIGAKASTSLAGLTLVSDADRTNLFAGIDGVQIMRPHCNLEDIVSGVAAVTDGSSTSCIAAQGSGVKVYITDVIISNSSATDVTVDLRDGTGGSVKATFPAPKTYSGAVKSFTVPLPFSANTAVAVDPSASASTITVTLVGFKSKV